MNEMETLGSKQNETNSTDRLRARNGTSAEVQQRLPSSPGGSMTLLNNLIKIGGSAVILKDIADRILGARINREQTLRRKNAGMLAMGVALGGAVGAIAGILYAPKAGRETREELSQRSCDAWGKMKDNVSTTGHKLVDAVEEKSARVYTAAEKGVDAAKESFKETSDLREKNA